jgi:TetR/AcrR family transcriptional repressor of nem operon
MPRPQTHSPGEIVWRALPRFWWHGYSGTSIDDLVRVTGASRHAIYQAFGGKRQLFMSCLAHYRETVVTPAFAQVEREGAGLTEVAAFLEYQIAQSEAAGLPGPGCLFANTMTEIAPHDPEMAALVRAHNDRLASGFRKVLRGSAGGRALSPRAQDDVAKLMASSIQGLWSISRTVSDPRVLRRLAASLVELVQHRIGNV